MGATSRAKGRKALDASTWIEGYKLVISTPTKWWLGEQEKTLLAPTKWWEQPPKAPPLEEGQVFQNIFPDREYTEILNYAAEKPEDFITDIQKKGWTAETEAAIKFFAPEVTREELQGLFGAVAPYEPENPFKDNVIDPFLVQGAVFGLDTRTRFLTTLPSVIQDIGGGLKDFGYELLSIPGKSGAFLGAILEGKSINEASNIAQQVGEKVAEPITLTIDEVLSRILPDVQKAAGENFLRLNREKQEWLESHPEYAPNPKYLQNPFENPELFKDPGY